MLTKQKPERDAKYLAFIRTLPCACCGVHSLSVPHHHNAVGHGGKGSKCSDYRAIPLCSLKCHNKVHQIGRSSFWGDLDAVETLIVRLNMRYFFGDHVSHT